jgi:hypothetical protein
MRDRPSAALLLTLSAPLLVALVTASGCDRVAEGPQRFVVEGTVTFRGEPVPMGRILFEPDSAAGNRGPVGMADIKAGRYSTGLRFGAVGGPHFVRIEGFRVPGSEGFRDDAAPQPLFREYSTEIELPQKASTQDFAVPEQKAAKK